MRRILLVTTVAVMMAAMAAMATSAAASKPIVDEGSIERDVVVADCSKFGVGDFLVRDRYVLNFSAKLFFDKNGTLVRIVEQIDGTDTFYNSETGKEFTSRFQNTEHIDLTAEPVDAVTGVQALLTVPGSGAVLLDVGRIVIDLEKREVIFEAGPHQLVGGDVKGLCEALAPEPQEE